MSMVVVDKIRKDVFDAFPDKKAVSWDDAYKLVPDNMRKQVDAMTFGKPDDITRSGNNFVARAKQGAQLPPIKGFTAFSDKVVKFTVNPVAGDSLKITDISGIEIETPVGARFKVTNVAIGIDDAGNFTFSSTKFLLFTVTVTISPKGEYLGWRLG